MGAMSDQRGFASWAMPHRSPAGFSSHGGTYSKHRYVFHEQRADGLSCQNSETGESTDTYLSDEERCHPLGTTTGRVILLAGLAEIPQKRQSHTLGEAFSRYQQEIFPRKKASTARSQRHLIPFLLKTLGASTRLEDITPTSLRKLCDGSSAKLTL